MVTLDQAGAATSSLGLRAPAPGLRPWIEHQWLEKLADPGAPGHDSWRIVPDASAHVLYHRFRDRGAGSSRLLLAGPRSVAADTAKSARSMTLGARLRPWAVPHLFGFPANDLTDRCASMEAVLGGEVRALRAELDGVPPERTGRVLSAWLFRRAVEADQPDPRLPAAVRRLAGSSATCGAVAESLDMSPRTMRSLVSRHVGLPPKTLSSIARLHGALRRIEVGGDRLSWSGIAAASGYFDQAHLIREFRRFLGETPEAWRRRGARTDQGNGDG